MAVGRQRTQLRRRVFVNGLAIGLVSGIVAAVVPVYGFPIVVVAIVASLAFRPRAPGAAGILIGVGTVFLYGVVNTWAACRQTDDFCGGTNIQPLLIVAVAMLLLGTATAGLSAARSRS
jgi:predicted lysophospholipase L1 biosynthesis ABC-type transport system permease subunit